MENSNQLITEKKVYGIGWMAFGAYLGGPLAGAYFLSKNFEVFGDKESARTSLVIGVVSTIFLFGSLAFIPESAMDKVPRSVIPATYTGLIYWYATTYQKKNIDAHIATGAKTYSSWRVGGISLLCLIPALLSLVVGAVFATLFLG